MFLASKREQNGRFTLFRRTKKLESRIDEFLDNVVEAALLFRRGVKIYLKRGVTDGFEECLEKAEELENRNDELRRRIETELYLNTLIPESREDVLRLLEHVDDLVNSVEANLFRFSIQQPDIPDHLKNGFRDLTKIVVECLEEVVKAARAFFRDYSSVRDFNSKVIFFETEADKVSTRIQREVFGSELPLENKRHLVYFVEKIDDLANDAEDIADELNIYAIKLKV